MAFKKIESTETGNLPFFAEWEKGLTPTERKAEVGQEYYAITIKEVRSGKGFMVSFTDFVVFVWKNSSEGRLLSCLFEQEKGDPFGCSLSLGKKSLTIDLGLFEDEVTYYVLNKPEEDVLSFRTEFLQNEYLKTKELQEKARESAKQRDEVVRTKAMETLKTKTT